MYLERLIRILLAKHSQNFSYTGMFISPLFVGISFVFYAKLIKLLNISEQFPMLLFLTFNLSVMSGFNNFVYFPFFALSLLVFRLSNFYGAPMRFKDKISPLYSALVMLILNIFCIKFLDVTQYASYIFYLNLINVLSI